MKIFLRTIIYLILVVLNFSCSEDVSRYFYNDSQPKNYFHKSNEVIFEVYYEDQAEPYVGNIGSSSTPLWQIFATNMVEIFKFRSDPPDVIVPTTHAEMFEMGDLGRDHWDVDSLISLHRQFRGLTPTSSQAVFYIYFLDGYLQTEDGPQTNIIGVNLTNTPFIFLFKPVIDNSGGQSTAKYVEQATLVHEVGHALGFVNNGVPMTIPHQDVEHGAHTTNEDCVMYWQSEGVAGLLKFLPRLIAGNFVLWGEEVMADAQEYSQ